MSTSRSEQYTNVRLADETHARLKAHTRTGENLSGAVARALDALERDTDHDDLARDIAEELLVLSDDPPGVLVVRDGELTREDAHEIMRELETVLED